jgi:hypothetical protein
VSAQREVRREQTWRAPGRWFPIQSLYFAASAAISLGLLDRFSQPAMGRATNGICMAQITPTRLTPALNATASRRHGPFRRFLRNTIHFFSYHFVLRRRSTWHTKVARMHLSVRPTVFHPRYFISSECFANFHFWIGPSRKACDRCWNGNRDPGHCGGSRRFGKRYRHRHQPKRCPFSARQRAA